MTLASTAYDVGPLEPFNDRTRRRKEISDLRKAFVGEPSGQKDGRYPWTLFDACGGDFYLTVLAAVQLHVNEERREASEQAAA